MEREKDPEYIAKLMRELLQDENAPKNQRDFNAKILHSFGVIVRESQNVGMRPLVYTNPRCGNCNFICVGDSKKRKELYKSLLTSGKVYIDQEGREYVKKLDEDGSEVVFYPPTEEEFFSKEEWESIDEIMELDVADLEGSVSRLKGLFEKYYH